MPSTQAFYPRLRAIGESVLDRIEREYAIAPSHTDETNLNQRIETARSRIIADCEQKLGINSNAHLPLRERVYKIQFLLDSQSEPSPVSVSLYKATMRLLNFDALYDGYVAADPTVERFLDTLTRLERDVLDIDRPQPKGDRDVLLAIGDPINLKDYLSAYKQERTQTVAKLTQQIQDTVQQNLNVSSPPRASAFSK